MKEMKYYGLGAKFPEPFTMKNEIVIQYEVKLEETLGK
jgi:hypothetical protein